MKGFLTGRCRGAAAEDQVGRSLTARADRRGSASRGAVESGKGGAGVSALVEKTGGGAGLRGADKRDPKAWPSSTC